MADAKEKLRNAVQAGDLEAVRQAQAEYEQLEAVTDKAFGILGSEKVCQEPLFSGNVESTRSNMRFMPAKYSLDTTRQKKLNSLYLGYTLLKRAGLTFKDLYTEPAKTARLIRSKLVTASGLNARPESIGATLQHGMKGSALDYYGPDKMLQVAMGDVFRAVGRAQAGLAGLEKDPQRRAQFLAAVHLGLHQGLHEAMVEVDRFKTMQKLCTNDEPRYVGMRDTLYQNAAIRPAAGPDALNLAKMMDSFGRPDQVTGEGVAHKDAGPNQIRYSWQDEMDAAGAPGEPGPQLGH